MAVSTSKSDYRLLLGVFACSLFLILTGQAHATWSIIVVNPETGEVGIGSATCLSNFDLKRNAGVIVVGKGAAQAQSLVDVTGQNRTTIANGLIDGLTAAEIMDLLIATDPDLPSHQYGIAGMAGDAETFTGVWCSAYASGVKGTCGPITYAIQGNILTGEPVVLAAEQALIQTEGDLAQKIMAAMHAAKHYGGDGRCSCDTWHPTDCGSPVVQKAGNWDRYWKSAFVSYLTVARVGDVDGVFQLPQGFANGEYYIDLNIITNSPPDPVDALQTLYDEFRDSWKGHADHILSEKTVYPQTIKADPQARAELMIYLVDLNNQPVTPGGASVTVTHDDQSAGSTTINQVTDHGDGFYSVWLTAPDKAGTDLFRIVVDDGMGSVTLYPLPTLVIEPLKDHIEHEFLSK